MILVISISPNVVLGVGLRPLYDQRRTSSFAFIYQEPLAYDLLFYTDAVPLKSTKYIQRLHPWSSFLEWETLFTTDWYYFLIMWLAVRSTAAYTLNLGTLLCSQSSIDTIDTWTWFVEYYINHFVHLYDAGLDSKQGYSELKMLFIFSRLT